MGKTNGTRLVRLLMIFLVFAVMLPAVPAQADKFPANGLRLADSRWHDYCFFGAWAGDEKSVVRYAMNNVLDGTTVLADIERASCISRNYDIWWMKDDYIPGGFRGWYQCVSVRNGRCNSANVTLSFPTIDVGPWDWEDRRNCAVHEVGHSLGLDHDFVSAMRNGAIPDPGIKWRRYSAHDLGHINGTY